MVKSKPQCFLLLLKSLATKFLQEHVSPPHQPQALCESFIVFCVVPQDSWSCHPCTLLNVFHGPALTSLWHWQIYYRADFSSLCPLEPFLYFVLSNFFLNQSFTSLCTFSLRFLVAAILTLNIYFLSGFTSIELTLISIQPCLFQASSALFLQSVPSISAWTACWVGPVKGPSTFSQQRPHHVTDAACCL